MTPAAEPTNPPATISAADVLLQEGELIILSIKPSRWFVALVSWPVLLAAALVAVGVALADRLGMCPVDRRLIQWLCGGVVVVRLAGGAAQWATLRYILTSRRLLRVGGSGPTGMAELPLACVHSAEVTQGSTERILMVGSLAFLGKSGRPLPMPWAYVAQPGKICNTVNEAIAKAHR